MTKKQFRFSNSTVDYYFDAGFAHIEKLVPRSSTVIITDEHVFHAHRKKFDGWNTVVLQPGEKHKVQATVDKVINRLIQFGADRQWVLVGVGGGVITDITGYVAGIFMRGIRFGFVPTSLLAMVDASVGGKNGIDVGMYKNMVGLIRQPSFLLFDPTLLKSLPKAEWQNGFAEIIKHAAIKDAAMFRMLQQHRLTDFQRNTVLLGSLIRRNVLIKTKVVLNDEFEKGERKLLNFGHTLGHAIENMYKLSHGQAISVGMTYAAEIAAGINQFTDTAALTALLRRYGLPTYMDFDRRKAFAILRKDKKKQQDQISYILLDKIGRGTIRTLSFNELEKILAK